MSPGEYKAFKIPTKKELLEKKIRDAFVMTTISLNRVNQNPFTEIEIRETDSPESQAQKIKPIADEKRRLFNTMRRIYRVSSSFGADRAAVFFKQASFMESFEDDYADQVQFNSYYPYYQILSHEQLRTYFTWRTKVRNGSISQTSLSYAFIYIYELLNNIGVENPQDGLEKLIGFWLTFREFDDVLDKYILQWFKDYHVYYPVEWSFHNFTDMYDLRRHYPSVYGYSSEKNNSFNIYAEISKYKIRNSTFYSEQTSSMIHLCFHYVLCSLRKTFSNKGLTFEDHVFFSFDREYHWSPFGSALFHPYFKQEDKHVVISKQESYTCSNNRWTHRAPVVTEEGKLLVGYIMKEVEAQLRVIKKFRYRIKADINKCDRMTLEKLEVHGIDITKIILDSVKEFYILFTRKIVKVDESALKQIRKDALDTQEKLIIPEDMEIASEVETTEEVVRPSLVSDIWAAFSDSLSESEFIVLSMILNKHDIKDYVIQKGVMTEVLIDSINEKAMDHIGDVILESGETVVVFEDYTEDLKEMVESNDK